MKKIITMCLCLAAALFCGENGVEVDYDNSTAYLVGWSKYLHDTPAKTIVTAIYQAQKAARLMGGESLASVKGKSETNETERDKAA